MKGTPKAGEQTNQTEKKAKRFSIALLIFLGILALLIFTFAFITDEIVLENETGFDVSIYHFIASFTTPAVTKTMVIFTFFGSAGFLFPCYLIISAWYLFFQKNSKNSIGVAAVALSGAAVIFLLKNIFKRQRPEGPLIQKVTSFSYPSGHSFSAFTFAGIIIYLVWQSQISVALKWVLSVLFILFAFMIAASRVYLHMHYASDVIAGFCLSLLWLSICYFILKKFNMVGIATK